MNGDAPATAPAPARLDDDNPWPGLDAFDEASRRYFHGRDEEIEELLRRVESSPLTVLFGKSGLGKTSLLRAGLMPRLRERNFLPVYARLDFQPGAPAPMAQLRDALHATLAAEGVDAPALAEGESLWAYLHRAGLEFWNRRNFPCTPVFVLDQFEEVFTLGERQPEVVSRLRIELGDLAENRIPVELAASEPASEEGAARGLALRAMPYKMLLSLREDYLPELESWRAAIPSLGKVRVRLLPLRPEQALAAVHQAAPHLMDERLARRIVDFVAAAQGETLSQGSPAAAVDGNAPALAQRAAEVEPALAARAGEVDPAPAVRAVEVEPALLSLFCRGLNEQRRQQHKPRFDDALLDGAKQGILGDYYRSCFEGMPESVSRFVATELITEKGYRNSVAKDDATPAGLSEAQLSTLIDRRLLRVEERYGVQRIELTHDLLTRVVREHRDRLRQEEAQAAAAQSVAAERQALEQRLQAERQAERERQLQAEARAGRRFKRLALALAAALVVAIGASAVALQQSAKATQAAQEADAAAVVAQRAAALATSQSALATRQSALAQQRLQRMIASIGMKQAVLSGDRARIGRYLSDPATRSAVRFTAVAESLGYKNPQGQTVYRFVLKPAPELAATLQQEAAVVTYRMDHPTFQNSLLATGPERGFSASYNGWGCLSHVVVLIEYVDPDRAAEITAYNMCTALGW